MTVNKGSVTFHQFLPFLNMKQIFLLNGKIDDSCLSSLSSCRLIHALGPSRSVLFFFSLIQFDRSVGFCSLPIFTESPNVRKIPNVERFFVVSVSPGKELAKWSINLLYETRRLQVKKVCKCSRWMKIK